jgi:hypothetical protein
MQQADPNAKETFGASAYNRLQQDLIEIRTQRDRQIGQLMRLNQLSDALLAEITSAQVAETFAEAIVDVLDIGIGALWLFDETLPETSRFALCGTRAPRSVWAAAGQELLQRLQERVSKVDEVLVLAIYQAGMKGKMKLKTTTKTKHRLKLLVQSMWTPTC